MCGWGTTKSPSRTKRKSGPRWGEENADRSLAHFEVPIVSHPPSGVGIRVEYDVSGKGRDGE